MQGQSNFFTWGKFVECKKCGGKMLLKKWGCGFHCQLQVEKDDKLYDLTVFPITLWKFFNVDILMKYASCPEQLKFELLELEDNITITYNNSRVITTITRQGDVATNTDDAN